MPPRKASKKSTSPNAGSSKPKAEPTAEKPRPPFRVRGHRNDVRAKGLPPWLVPGNPGNRGGGRPPNEIRLMYREVVSVEGVAWLSEVMNDPYRSDKIKREALELAAKLSMGFKGTAEDETEEVDLPSMSIVVSSTPPALPDDL